MHNYIALKIDEQEHGIASVEWVFKTIGQLIECCPQKELAKIDKSLEPLLGNCCRLPPTEYYRVPVHFIRELIKIKDMKCKFSGFEVSNAEESFAPLGPPGTMWHYSQIITYFVKLTLISVSPDPAFTEFNPCIQFVNLRTNQIYNAQISYLGQPINVLKSDNREGT